MRRLIVMLAVAVAGVLTAGLTSAIATSDITVEETIVFSEHTTKGRNLDFAGGPDSFKPGDQYLFRSELSDAGGVVAHLNADCLVHFGKRDSCSLIYELPPRGEIVAEGQVPVSQLVVGGTWTFAITGGTGDFENVRGSVTVEIVDDSLNSQHTLHLLP
jgi:hypothetical protein